VENIHHTDKIRQLCKEIAADSSVTAICMYGSRAGGYAKPDSDFDILLVLEGFRKGAGFYYRRLNQTYAAILAVERKLLELDAKNGSFGEFLCTRLLGPYAVLENPSFLKAIEILAKRRVVEEELVDLVTECGELSRGLVIDPAYLALSRLRKRARLYPALLDSYSNMLRPDLKETNLRLMLDGYQTVLEDLHRSGLIRFENHKFALEDRFIDKILSNRSLNKVVNVVEMSRRAIQSYLTYGRAHGYSFEKMLDELSSALQRSLQLGASTEKPEDPRNYLFLRTSTGIVQWNERSSVIDLALKLRPNAKIAITPLAGVLNDVYLVSADQEQLVAKKYTDWFSLKWFTINLVTLGTKKFSVMGSSRLANEYGMNRVLSREGIPVPDVLHVSIPDRVLVERYIPGRNIADLVKLAASSDQLSASDYELASRIGRTMATIHSIGVSIGDSKPENFVHSNDGKIYSLDLEQASKKGDKAWDISEFLFYSGHYSPLMTSGLSQLVDGFVEGYAEIGERSVLRRAAGVSYIKVFSIWTAPPVMYKIAEILRKA
jgi:tRNA A-37 threonylcarbamoyl transferase component Bud32/predicted nucleotidyltransferase